MGTGEVWHVYTGVQGTHDATLYILTKGYTVPGHKGTHDKLSQIQFVLLLCNSQHFDFQKVFDVKYEIQNSKANFLTISIKSLTKSSCFS